MRARAPLLPLCLALLAVWTSSHSPSPVCAASDADTVLAQMVDGYFNLTSKYGTAALSKAQLDSAFDGLVSDLAAQFTGGSDRDVVVYRTAALVRGLHVITFGFTGSETARNTAADAVEGELEKERRGQRSSLPDGKITAYLDADETGAFAEHTVRVCDHDVYVEEHAACPSGGGGGSNAGAVVGAVFGVIFGVAVVVGGLLWWKRRSQHRRNLEYTLQGDGLLDDSLGGGGYQPPRAAGGSFAELEDLPPGWIQQVDDHGNVYYYHLQSDTSQWAVPTA